MQEQPPPDFPADPPAPAHSPDDTAEFAPQPGPVSLVDELRDVHFPIARRGYDRLAVDAYVARVSHGLSQLEAVNSPQDAVQRALDEVGQQTAAILRQAQETANEMRTRAEAEARQRLEGAVQQATKLISDAEADVRRLDEDTDRIWGERRRLLEDTRRLAEGLLGLADDALDRFPADTGEDETVGSSDQVPPGATDPEGVEAEAADPGDDAELDVDHHEDSTIEVLPPPATEAGASERPADGAPPHSAA